jgi:hypothetical protein
VEVTVLLVKTLIVIIPILLLSSAVNATVIHVPSEQPTVQDGINAASDGDTILIAPDTYYENIVIDSLEVTLIGEAGRDSTILDGSLNGTVVTVNRQCALTLAGLQIQRGSATTGGIQVSRSHLCIVDCYIHSNEGTGDWNLGAGAIDCYACSLFMAGCTLEDNGSQRSYGAIKIWNSQHSRGIVDSNLVVGNASSLFCDDVIMCLATVFYSYGEARSDVSDSSNVIIYPVGVEDIAAEETEQYDLPDRPEFALWPNPSSSGCTIELDLSEPANVTADLFNTSGRKVAEISRLKLEPGRNRIAWDGRDDSGNPLPSGIYFCRIDCDGIGIFKKVVVLR